MPVENRGEDVFHGLFIKCLNADNIQMAQEARGHHITTASWRTHCTQHQDILQFKNTGVFSERKQDVILKLSVLFLVVTTAFNYHRFPARTDYLPSFPPWKWSLLPGNPRNMLKQNGVYLVVVF